MKVIQSNCEFVTPLFDTVIHYISIIVIKVKTELQLFSIILKNVIKLQLITITILITPTLGSIETDCVISELSYNEVINYRQI